MRKLVTATVAVLLCAGVAMAKSSSGTGTTANPKGRAATACPATASMKACTVSGTVAAVDVAAGTITVQPKKKGSEPVVFTVSATTKITRNGKKVTLAEILVGDKIDVKAKGPEVITVKAKGPRPKPAPKAEAPKSESGVGTGAGGVGE